MPTGYEYEKNVYKLMHVLVVRSELDTIKAAAKSNDESVAHMINRLLQNELKKNGIEITIPGDR